MKTKTALPCLALLLSATAAAPAFADEGGVPRGVPHLDHVFVIMMENHGYSQIIGNPNAPFMNLYAQRVNLATNYFAVAHPSLTNYLEVVGGSNFGVLNDNSPDWHNATCTTHLALGHAVARQPAAPPICPIAGTGTDAATPVFDNTNETTPARRSRRCTEIDGTHVDPRGDRHDRQDHRRPARRRRARAGRATRRDVSPGGADLVNYSDGYFDNTSDLATTLAAPARRRATSSTSTP